MASLFPFQRAFNSSSCLRLKQLPARRSILQTSAIVSRPPWQLRSRPYATESLNEVEPPEHLSEGERKVFDMIKEGLQPIRLEVQDISGGCGSMYALDIVSEQFKGLPIIKQHRMVNQVLGEEMKKWHGVQMKTKAP